MSTAIVQHRNVPPSLAAKMQSMGARIQRAREKTKEQEEIVIRSLVCGATGAGIGYLDGRHDKREVMGMEISLIGAVAAHAAGFALGKENASYSHAVGDSCLTLYSADFMRKLGKEARDKANGTTTSTAF